MVGELLQCDVLGVISPPLHLLIQTDRNRYNCAQTSANTQTQMGWYNRIYREGKLQSVMALNIQRADV